jgi:hypothetical protein
MLKNTLLVSALILLFVLTVDAQELSYRQFQLESQFTAQNRTEVPSLQYNQAVDAAPKSVGRAFLMSVILPGSGEFYSGNSGQGRFFLGMELLLWSGLIGNKMYVDMLKDDYYAFAVQHAGVSRSGKDKEYWISIGKFDDLYSYNEQRRRDRFVDAIYPEDDSYYWRWDSRANRFKYDEMRLTANEIEGRDTYFYAAIMLNHLVSGINAMRLARKHNRTMALEKSWDLRFFAYRHEGNQHLFGFRFFTLF